NECNDGNHWLGLELGTKDHRDLVGTKLILKVGDLTLTRFITSGGSYLSSNDPRRVFGLGKATKIDELTVMWPPNRETGKRLTEHWKQLAIDRYHRITQEEGRP